MRITNLSLSELMELPLPAIYLQKRLCFRPSPRFLHHTFELINHTIFNNELKKPKLELHSNCRKYWGVCMGNLTTIRSGSYCHIVLMDKFFCAQWFITTLAHEMVHQYQWDILGPMREEDGKNWLMSHGPSFFNFRNTLHENNISLKTAHSQRRWFKHQDLFKC